MTPLGSRPPPARSACDQRRRSAGRAAGGPEPGSRQHLGRGPRRHQPRQVVERAGRGRVLVGQHDPEAVLEPPPRARGAPASRAAGRQRSSPPASTGRAHSSSSRAMAPDLVGDALLAIGHVAAPSRPGTNRAAAREGLLPRPPRAPAPRRGCARTSRPRCASEDDERRAPRPAASGRASDLDDHRQVVGVAQRSGRGPPVTGGAPGSTMTRVFQRSPSVAIAHQRSAWAASASPRARPSPAGQGEGRGRAPPPRAQATRKSGVEGDHHRVVALPGLDRRPRRSGRRALRVESEQLDAALERDEQARQRPGSACDRGHHRSSTSSAQKPGPHGHQQAEVARAAPRRRRAGRRARRAPRPRRGCPPPAASATSARAPRAEARARPRKASSTLGPPVWAIQWRTSGRGGARASARNASTSPPHVLARPPAGTLAESTTLKPVSTTSQPITHSVSG